MVPPLRLYDALPPAVVSGAHGHLRCAAIDALLYGQAAALPRSVAEGLLAWAGDLCTPGMRGLDLAGVPEPWLPVLRWAGVPLALVAGELRWGRDLVAADVPLPLTTVTAVALPPPERLAVCTAVQLRPLRALCARRCGVDLRSAPGVQFYLWSDHALTVSTVDVPVGGFLLGPQPGNRSSLTLPPGGFQVVRW